MKIELTRIWQIVLMLCGAFGFGYSMHSGDSTIAIGSAVLFVIVVVTAKQASKTQ